MSGSNLRRIESLRKQHQLRAIEGLKQSHEALSVCRSASLYYGVLGRLHYQTRSGCGVTAVTYAIVPPSVSGYRRLVLPGNQRWFTPHLGIGDVGAEDHRWGGAAVVLGARESRVQGEGQQGWRV